MIWDNCPDTEQLYRLLNEQLEPHEEADLIGHIETCEHCHQALERLTSGRVPAEFASAPGHDACVIRDLSTRQSSTSGSERGARRSLS
jgi:hypothetical protein